MILSFKQKFPWGVATLFPFKIMAGVKKHTIREDKHHRWKPGRIIHMATGVRTKFYNCFYKAVCKSTQSIVINYHCGSAPDGMSIYIDGDLFYEQSVYGTCRSDNLSLLAKNDGFDSPEDFLRWFCHDFKGKIIHWTDFRY